MKTLLSALVMPETVPTVRDVGSLLLFFDSLSYYLPTESDSNGGADYDLFRGHCAVYAPAPLGEDLNRFTRLLHELENSRGEDISRLFASAKSPITSGEIRDKSEATTGNVFTTLHRDNNETAHIQYKERLWQARLLLKLAELLDRREREVKEGLAHITTAEKETLSALEGDDAFRGVLEQSSNLEQPTGMSEYSDTYSTGGSSLLISLRLGAWAELFLADSSPDRPFILVAPNSDYGSRILDGYENIWRRMPEKIISLTIPAIPDLGSSGPLNEQYFLKRNELRTAVRDHLEYFNNILVQTAARDNKTDSEIDPKHVAAWEEAVKIEFPESAAGRRKLDFYCFSDNPPEILMQKLFHLESPGNNQRDSAGILAVLHD
jgi:hypothetical protein